MKQPRFLWPKDAARILRGIDFHHSSAQDRQALEMGATALERLDAAQNATSEAIVVLESSLLQETQRRGQKELKIALKGTIELLKGIQKALRGEP